MLKIADPPEMEAPRKAYGETLLELGRENPDVVALDCDLSCSTQTAMFGKEFPDRFFNMGIAEQNMMGVASGLAAAGKIPFASTFAMFATGRGFEQIRQSICLGEQNVKVVATHAGLTVGEDGASHQCLEDIALMRLLPHMTVVVPCDATETRQAIRKVAELHGPCYVRLARAKFPRIVDPDAYEFGIGRPKVLRDGGDLTIVACGLMVAYSLFAADALKRDGIDARVVNLSTVKPLDRELIGQCAEETGRILTVEEHFVAGGMGSAVAEVVAQSRPVPMRLMGVKDRFGMSGKAGDLLQHYGLTPEFIAQEARQLLTRDA
jgi:transketolase